MQRAPAKKLLGIVMGMAMVAAACGGSDAESASDDEVTADSTTTTTAPEADEAAEQDVTTTDTTEALAVEGPTIPVPDQWLDGAASVEPSASGWPVAAGRWASGAFDPAIAFDLPAGLAVIDHSPWSVRLGLDQPGSTGQVHLLRSSTMTLSTDVSVPVPRELDEIDEFLAASKTSTVLNQGRIEETHAEIGWWEVVVDEDLPGAACSIGDNCVQIALTTGRTSVQVATGEPFVVFAYRGDNVRYGAYVTGTAEERAELGAVAEELLVSLTVLDRDAEPPEVDARFIGALSQSRSTLAAGSLHSNLGGKHIQIELAEPIDGVSLFTSESEMIILGMPAGDLAVIAYENMVVDPSLSQAGLDVDAGFELARLDDPPTSIDEWSDYADELGVLTATGTTEIGGVEIPWFEFAVEPGSGFECGPNYLAGAEECLMFLSRWSHSDAESGNRHFVFGDQNVMVVLWPAPSSTIDEVLAAYEPILTGLTVTSAE